MPCSRRMSRLIPRDVLSDCAPDTPCPCNEKTDLAAEPCRKWNEKRRCNAACWWKSQSRQDGARECPSLLRLLAGPAVLVGGGCAGLLATVLAVNDNDVATRVHSHGAVPCIVIACSVWVGRVGVRRPGRRGARGRRCRVVPARRAGILRARVAGSDGGLGLVDDGLGGLVGVARHCGGWVGW